MKAQKRNRLVAATTVSVVLLLVVLVAVMIYQIVEICVINKRKQEIAAQIAEYEKLVEEKENDLVDFYSYGNEYYEWLVYYDQIYGVLGNE